MRKHTLFFIIFAIALLISLTVITSLYIITLTLIDDIDTELVPEGRIKSIQGDIITLVLQIKFNNNGDADAPRFSAEYKIYVNGVYVGDGKLPPINIPRKSSVTTKTIIKINITKLGKAILQSLLHGNHEINIVIEGKEHIEVLPGLSVGKEFHIMRTVRFY